MHAPSPETEIQEYDVRREGDRWYARRRAPVSEEQRRHGIREELSAATWDDLLIACIAQRCRASWYR